MVFALIHEALAGKICQDIAISGFPAGHEIHKISLCADILLFLWIQPEHYPKALLNMIEGLSSVTV